MPDICSKCDICLVPWRLNLFSISVAEFVGLSLLFFSFFMLGCSCMLLTSSFAFATPLNHSTVDLISITHSVAMVAEKKNFKHDDIETLRSRVIVGRDRVTSVCSLSVSYSLSWRYPSICHGTRHELTLQTQPSI